MRTRRDSPAFSRASRALERTARRCCAATTVRCARQEGHEDGMHDKGEAQGELRAQHAMPEGRGFASGE